MKKHLGVMIGVVVGVVVVGGATAWYLASPLFINRSVDESFPFETPIQEDVAQAPQEERQAVVAQTFGPESLAHRPV